MGIIFVLLVSGCVNNPEAIYEIHKKSIFNIFTDCTVIINYPSFNVSLYKYDSEDDFPDIRAEQTGGNETISLHSGTAGTGFLVGDNIISNAHVALCENKDELERIRGYLKYLIEFYEPGFRLDYSYIEEFTDYNVSERVSFIFNEIESLNPETEWDEIGIEDYITWEIANYLYENTDVIDIEEGDIVAFYPQGNSYGMVNLSLVEHGDPFPGKDYSIMEPDIKPSVLIAELGDSDGVEIGEEVYVIGYPIKGVLDYDVFSPPTITKGIVSSKKTSELGIEYIQIDASASPGNSGGPVFNEQGKVIGILTAGTGETFNFVFPSKYLIESGI